MTHKVYIGLGANLDNPSEQIKRAIKHLAKIEKTQLVKVSSLYGSKPMGPQDQPDYMNAVALIETELLPLELLDQLQRIELDFGRVRKEERWGARILDLDILLFDQQIIAHERLTVPHYGMKEREFVIYPLAEINDAETLPDGTSIISLRNKLALNGLHIVAKLH
ncbi:2-amino-4-hydroxy-6-hydroxymethyldihydropteridine diphosphokinase [Thalassotalea crassostreae]|uniref:2-amino-4-hydroxy-6- hydroxymethyldihydropteridine diphosphokinase n=1 Tax=Thalassotalea crassostreae TaxID=1763536 RepID=UPI000838304F|nr:2-amino-4-hydroxy-6-hydroxymethyldihydropteridine diphosphokinase [Thalassotalea crassostreae]